MLSNPFTRGIVGIGQNQIYVMDGLGLPHLELPLESAVTSSLNKWHRSTVLGKKRSLGEFRVSLILSDQHRRSRLFFLCKPAIFSNLTIEPTVRWAFDCFVKCITCWWTKCVENLRAQKPCLHPELWAEKVFYNAAPAGAPTRLISWVKYAFPW